MGSDIPLQKKLCAGLGVLLGLGCRLLRPMGMMDPRLLTLLAFLQGVRLAWAYSAVEIVVVIPVPLHDAVLVRSQSLHSRTLGVSHHS
jgi:hypothetical protein